MVLDGFSHDVAQIKPFSGRYLTYYFMAQHYKKNLELKKTTLFLVLHNICILGA